MMNEQIRDNGNAIWVGTTAGDMDYYTGATNKARIPIGTAGQVLKVNSGATAPEWGYSGVIKRQGGSETVWSTAGTNNYTPTESKIQAGVISITVTDDNDQTEHITFPIAFTYAPIAFCTWCTGGGTGGYVEPVVTNITSLTNTGMSIQVQTSGTSSYTFNVHWMAIGI
jgi:hypothetical protein